MNVTIPETEGPEAWRSTTETRGCLHCGNNLGNFRQHDQGPFCCRGCRNVYQMIHQADLERYYDLKSGAHAPAANLDTDDFDWLDRHPARDAHSRDRSEGILHLDLDIQGIHCAACVWLVEELFRRCEGGIDLRINPTLGKVELIWDPARGELKSFLIEIEKFGYRLGPATREPRRQSRDLLMRMAISIAMALNVMMFSLSYYFGLGPEDGALYPFMGWLSLLLATVSLIAGGGVFFRGALAGLKRRIAHLDLPISLGMILAYSGSVWGFMTKGPEEAYFDTLTIFIALMLVGRWAREHILERNRNALLDSVGAENISAKRMRGEKIEVVAATEIKQGDELWIAPGDLLSVDGILLRQAVEVSLDWISGESDRIAFAPGDRVPAGAFNASRQGFVVVSGQDFADSRLQELLRSPPAADDQYHPQWWHRISTAYVALVLLAATAGFLGWARTDIGSALKVTISILVVTCPCALGLASPLAEELIHFALRRSGVFLRKQSFLEKALSVKKILLDKTGTLTLGRLKLAGNSGAALGSLDVFSRGVLQYMTTRSNHPVSICLSGALAREGVAGEVLPAIIGETLLEIPGKGLELVLDGITWRLGREELAPSRGNTGESGWAETVFTRDGRILATFKLSEDFKADAADELAGLSEAGYEIHLLSGDSQKKVDAAVVALDLIPENARGGLSPEAKAARVAEIDRCDTLMVGDGLNDSPSFEAAFCAATPAVDRPVLPGKADFYFLGDGIAAIRRALFAARQLRQVQRLNLVFAILYNILAVALCMAGLVTPVVAAVLMPASSVGIVSLTAIRLSSGRLKWAL